MVSRHEKVVATQNSVKGKTVKSRHEIVAATQTLRDKKMWSQQESSLLATKRGHEEAIPVAIAT